jgi:hypothetical protein
MKNKNVFALILLAAVFSVLSLSPVFAAKYEGVDNVSGYLVFLQKTPSQIEIVTENRDRLKFFWTAETVFVDWQEQELSPEDFYRQFKDKGVFLFLDGKKITRIAPAVF